MANFNKALLMGNLTRDPELKFTPNGVAVANFSLAVNRQFKGTDGEIKKEVSFFNIVVWNKQAENCAKYLKKGSSALVEGRLATRSYEAKDGGGKRTVTEIVAENVQFLSSPRQADGEQSDRQPQDQEAPPEDASGDVPF